MSLIITSLWGGHRHRHIYIHTLCGQNQLLEIRCSKKLYHINYMVVNNTKHKGSVTESYTVPNNKENPTII